MGGVYHNQAQYDAAEEPCGVEPGVYPCRDCGDDVGEYATFHTHGQYTERGPRRVCPECEEPLCRACADKDSEISERCAKCAGVNQ